MKTSGHKISDVSDKSGNSEGAAMADGQNKSPVKQPQPYTTMTTSLAASNPMKSSFSKMG